MLKKTLSTFKYGEFLRLFGFKTVFDLYDDYSGKQVFKFLLLNNRPAFDDLMSGDITAQKLRKAFQFPDWVLSEISGLKGDDLKLLKQIMAKLGIAPMSFGSRNEPSYRSDAISQALGMEANTGEGGEPKRFTQMFMQYGKSVNSVDELLRLETENPEQFEKFSLGIYHMFQAQVASGLFGINLQSIMYSILFLLKDKQGAKNAQGGQLNGSKVNSDIAETRGAPEGVTLISPPNMHDIYSIEELASKLLSFMLANPGIQPGIKIGALTGSEDAVVGIIEAYKIARQKLEKLIASARSLGIEMPTEIPKIRIIIDGSEGGTGAADTEAIVHAGAEARVIEFKLHNLLVEPHADGSPPYKEYAEVFHYGGVSTPESALTQMVLNQGTGFGTFAFILQGCIKANICQNGKCPANIATGDQERIRSFIRDWEERGLAGNKQWAHLEMGILMVHYIKALFAQVHPGQHLTDIEQIWGDMALLQVSPDSPFDFDRLVQHLKAVREHASAGVQTPKDEAFEQADGEDSKPALSEAELQALRDESPLEKSIPPQAEGFELDLAVIQNAKQGIYRAQYDMLSSQGAGLTFLSHWLMKNPLPDHQRLDIDVKGGFSGPHVANLMTGPINLHIDTVGDSAGMLLGKDAFLHVRKACGNCCLYGANGGVAVFDRGVRAGDRFFVCGRGARVTVENTGNYAAEFVASGSIFIHGTHAGENLAQGAVGGKIFYRRDVARTVGENPEIHVIHKEYPVVNPEDVALLRQHIEDMAQTGDVDAQAWLRELDEEEGKAAFLGQFLMIDPQRHKQEVQPRQRRHIRVEHDQTHASGSGHPVPSLQPEPPSEDLF